MKTHKDLNVWKEAINLVTEIYRVTSKFPREELYGLTSQIRRAAVSIPSNIAEGSARNHSSEYKQFLYVSLGSAAELNTQLLISCNLEFIKAESIKNILNALESISKMLQGLIKSIDK